jgi:molybdopterin-containing oxidoreductase family membrane subunit
VAGIGGLCLAYQIRTGLGVTGYTRPAMWAVYITNFVFWVGIGHAGTLISAILYLFRAAWRQSIYRISEAMTVFAVMTAGLFPLIHLGRVWFFYWLLPYPNQRELWINFRSPPRQALAQARRISVESCTSSLLRPPPRGQPAVSATS